MIRKTVVRSTKLLVCGVFGVAGYVAVNKNPYEQFKKPEIKQIISREPYNVQLFLHLPLNSISRFWGKINQLEVPTFFRPFFYSWYINTFKVDVTEAENEDLKSYRCLGEFFTRSLKKEARPISEQLLVSPSDGLILSLGRVEADQVRHVKNKDYSLEYFIGPKTWHLPGEGNHSAGGAGVVGNVFNLLFSGLFGAQESANEFSPKQKSSHESATTLSPPLTTNSYFNSLKTNPSNQLYQCTIYLAPGDYHRFHSPADWKCIFRRHFPGYLLSVNPRMADRVPELMNANERVLYVGTWPHGFFSMSLVGATNVGSIEVYTDPTLVTNKRANLPTMIDSHFSENEPIKMLHSSHTPSSSSLNSSLSSSSSSSSPLFSTSSSSSSSSSSQPSNSSAATSHTFCKGAPFGQFNLGSSIVLLFEAPANFQFSHTTGDKIKFGEAL